MGSHFNLTVRNDHDKKTLAIPNYEGCPRIRRKTLKCFKTTSDIDKTVHVFTFMCVCHIVGIHKKPYK